MNSKVYGCYLKKMYGGRTAFARFFDFVMLRALLLTGLFLLFLHFSKSLTTALLVSIFLTMAVSIFLFTYRTKKAERYIKKDIADLKRKCLLESLTLMDLNEFAGYMGRLFGGFKETSYINGGFFAENEDGYFFALHNHPGTKCDTDNIIEILRGNRGKKITIISLSEFTNAAKALCKYEGYSVKLIGGAEVLAIASKADMLPDESAAQKKAEEEMEYNIITISKIKDAAVSQKKVKAYTLCGLAAVFWPFVTGFKFYYPVIAAACFFLAAVSRRKSRDSKGSASA
ncbi:MAG: hypothetical protein WDA65_01130 [Christensenellales bacterium]